jgi:hypothetical protein
MLSYRVAGTGGLGEDLHDFLHYSPLRVLGIGITGHSTGEEKANGDDHWQSNFANSARDAGALVQR